MREKRYAYPEGSRQSDQVVQFSATALWGLTAVNIDEDAYVNGHTFRVDQGLSFTAKRYSVPSRITFPMDLRQSATNPPIPKNPCG